MIEKNYQPSDVKQMDHYFSINRPQPKKKTIIVEKTQTEDQ